MKKSLFLLTAVAVALFSCEKEQDFITENPDLSGKTVTVKASHEADDAEVKTTVDGSGNVEWETTDKLSFVYDGGSAESNAAGVPGTSAEFTATLPGGKEALYLVYPSSVTAEYESSSLKVTVPATQDGTFASAAIEVAQFAATCDLKNLGAILAITTTADVDEIVISSNNSTPLAGKATVAFAAGIPSVDAVASGSTSVTLSGLGGAGTYYAAVLPDSYAAGIYVELKKSGSVVGEKISGNALTVARRKIMRINVGNPGTIANKKFFKADGTGDGSSWDSPLGPSDLITVLTADSDATLFLAQGTYTLTGEIQMKKARTYKIYGGFPSSATGTSLSNRDFSVETIISGDNTYRILIPWNASLKLTVDGITLANAYSASSIGTALVFESHGGSTVNNCIIRNNQTATSTSANGGAVRVKGKVTFTNCSFENNTTAKASGGAIAMIASGSPDLTLVNCSFSNNTAPSGTGGIIVSFGGTLVAKNCTFGGSSAGNGGVLRASTSSGIKLTASFSECTFSGNFATNSKQIDADGALAGTGIGGAVFSLNGASEKEISISAENCTFRDNIAHPSKAKLTSGSTLKGAGSIASIGQHADVRLKDCLLLENHTGFAAFVVNENSSLYLNRCRLWECKAVNDATVVYNNDGKVAFHNCVLYNNADLKGQQTDHINCNFYNTENGHLLLSCCSFRNNTTTSLFRGSDSTPDNNTVLINNIITNKNTTGGSFDTDSKYTSHGNNIVTKKSNWSNPGVWAGSIASDVAYTAEGDANETGNPAVYVSGYYLKTSLAGLSFTKATRTDVTTAIGTFDSNNDTGVLTWLGADAVSVDVMKNPRGATEIMPGCYEGD